MRAVSKLDPSRIVCESALRFAAQWRIALETLHLGRVADDPGSFSAASTALEMANLGGSGAASRPSEASYRS